MTKLRKPPKVNYHLLIVRPTSDFAPRDWRDKPECYTIVSYEGPRQLRGRADAWRFTYNQARLETGMLEQWAIVCERLESFSAKKPLPLGNTRIEKAVLSR